MSFHSNSIRPNNFYLQFLILRKLFQQFLPEEFDYVSRTQHDRLLWRHRIEELHLQPWERKKEYVEPRNQDQDSETRFTRNLLCLLAVRFFLFRLISRRCEHFFLDGHVCYVLPVLVVKVKVMVEGGASASTSIT